MVYYCSHAAKNSFAVGLVFFCITVAALTAPSYGQPSQEQQQQMAQQSQYINAYINAVNTIQAQANRYLNTLAEGIKSAASNRNKTLRDTMLLDGKKIIDAVIQQLNRITPPDELKIYHMKIIDVFVYRGMANNALLGNNVEAASRFYRQGSLAHIQALSELKRVFISYDAPAGVIGDLDAIIKSENEVLGVLK